MGRPLVGNPGNKGGGRRPKSVEVNILKYYEDLLPKVFLIVREKLENGNKKDRLWAMEWLKTGIVKMIPQKIGGDPNNRVPIPISNVFVNGVSNNLGNTQDSQANQAA